MPKNNSTPSSFFSPANASTGFYRLILQIVVLTFAYFVTGKLGGYLAIPPGYATAIWPPSGIALAAILLYGYRIWPGVLLGSLLVNTPVVLVDGSLSDIVASAIIPLAIGSGASLQAVVGGYLIRRFAGFPNSLCREKEVFLFFLYGGILSTLVSSSLAVTVLVSNAQISAAHFLTNWFTWWIGDVLGIFIFTPLVLVWMQSPRECWRNRRRPISLTIITLFTLTTVAVFYESQNENKRLTHEFEDQARTLNTALLSTIRTHLNVLKTIGGFYSASTTVEREGFHRFVAHALSDFHGIQALSWNPLILAAERKAFEANLQREGYPIAHITERNANQQVIVAGNRTAYVPISFIEPHHGNETALGYDVSSNELRHEAMNRARDSGDIAATARIHLVQEQGNQSGFLAFLPVYHNGSPHATQEERRSNLSGYAVAVFKGGDMVTAALKNLNQTGLSYRLIDQSVPTAEQLIFAKDTQAIQPLKLQKTGLFGKEVTLASHFTFPIGGRLWRFEVVPAYDYLSYYHSNNVWFILLAGFLLTSLGAVFVLVSSGRDSALQQLVDERTAALAHSKAHFQSTFEAAPIGVVNVSLEGRFIAVNQSYCDLLGYSRDELLTMVVEQVTYPDCHLFDGDIITQFLAGESAVFHGEKKYLCKNGDWVWGNLSLKLMYQPDGSPDYFIGIIENITRRKQSEDALTTLSWAVEQSPHSIMITDVDANLEYVNAAFVNITGYSRDEVIGRNPKMFHSTQTSKATHDEMWATLSKGEIWKGELINKKKDGTEYIEAALISPVRQLDGSISHYVGIKEDITQQKQADARLHESEQRFRIVADAAPVLIWLADVDKLYFWFNQVWLEFTGRSMAQEAGHGWAEGVHPDDLAHCLAIYSDHFDRRDAFMMEYRLKRHDGEYRWVEDHGVPRFDSAGVFVGYIGSCIDITERYLMRIQLQANNDLLFKLSQQVPGMIYQFQLLPDGSSCFPYASDGIWDIYEVAPDWVSESSEPVLAVLHPDDYDRIMASILESADTLCPWHLEYRVKLPRKGIRWLSGLSRPEKMADGSILWHGFIADITEQRIARNEASQIKKELESVLASATEISIIATDTNGMIQMFNCGAERMLGYRADEMIGKQTAAIIHTPAEIEQRSRELTLERGQSIVGFQVFVAKAMQSGQETREWTYVRKDQSTLIVSLVVTLIRNAQDEISGYLGIAEDITQRKQTEQAMREAKEAAEALVRSKSEFLASMSHEIRTPMNAIIGLSFLALNKELTADTRDYLEKINGASNSLLSILNDILDFSKLEAGEVSIEHHLFNLDTLVDNLSALFVDRAAEQRLDFNIAITPDVPRNLIGDSLRLQQILVNLLGNAIKFTQQGAVTLNISVAHNDPAHVQLLFCVIDTGIGMSDADINKLFKPFSQVDGSITRRFGGTGLGLAISQTLLQKMGGQFLVASTLGQGSCFSFELMFDVSSLASDCKTAPATSAFAFDNLLAGKRILVAEDNLINQQVIREILTLSGITVEMANTGKEALTLLEKGSFDAVLMDVHMPEMDGFEATQFIRSQARFATLPVIALTAGVTKEERGRCMASGMNAFIAKPINPKTLFSTLVQWTTQPISAITARVAEPPSVAYQTSVEDVPVDVPVLDLTYLLAILDDNQALMTQLLFDFMDDMKDLPDDLDALVTAKNWGAVGERIHLIKGVSGTVGAMQLYEATQRLEAELTEEPETASFSAFRAIFQHTMVAITALAQQKEPMPLTSGGNNLERERCAAELDQMLKGNDFITASVLTHFKSHLAPSQFDLFFQLHKLIDQLRYREARAILRQLAKLPDILGSQHD